MAATALPTNSRCRAFIAEQPDRKVSASRRRPRWHFRARGVLIGDWDSPPAIRPISEQYFILRTGTSLVFLDNPTLNQYVRSRLDADLLTGKQGVIFRIAGGEIDKTG